MITIPVKAKERLAAGIKRFQPILTQAQDKDINESDTVTIVADMLSEVFGYDKYTEITSEYSIKKTFCDLAIKLDSKPILLIETKAAGMNLKENHIKQAVDYGANSGIEWVVLTNAVHWMVYKIIFSKPVDTELVYEFDILQMSSKKQSDLELLYYLSKEAMLKSSKISIEDYRAQKQIMNRFTIGQIILSEPVLDAIKKQIKKMAVTAKVANEEIAQIICEEVLKRDILDGDKACDAKKKVTKAMKAAPAPARKPKTKVAPESAPEEVPAEE